MSGIHEYESDEESTLEDLAELHKYIEQKVKDIYRDIPGIKDVGVFIPVEWDPVNDVQIPSEWDGVVIVRADNKLSAQERREAILKGYRKYREQIKKEEYPRKHIIRTRTKFLFTIDELLASKEERVKWEKYRRLRKTAKKYHRLRKTAKT